MNAQRLLIALSFVGLLLTLQHWLENSPRPEAASDAPPAATEKSPAEPRVMDSEKPAEAAKPAAPKAQTRAPATPQPPVDQIAPPLKTLREEVAQNPHQTPIALLQFAQDLGDRLEAAEKSEPEARKFFDELETCVLNGAQAQSTRALCLANAKRLAGKYAAFGDRVTALKEKADPDIVRLTE
jgi:hypothetical protein